MSAALSSLVVESALYCLLACVAIDIAVAERQVGHMRLWRHHCGAALVYALLGAVHLLHR